MITKTIKLSHCADRYSIVIGRCGENEATTIAFDTSDFLKKFGAGRAELVHRVPGTAEIYPISLAENGDMVEWIVSNADTSKVGSGEAEIRWFVGSLLAKSAIIRTQILPSMTGAEGNAPDPVLNWIDGESEKIAQLIASIKYLDDENAIRTIIEAYLFENPQTDFVKVQQMIYEYVSPEFEKINGAFLSAFQKINEKADKSSVYTKTEVDQKVADTTPTDYAAVKTQVQKNTTDISSQSEEIAKISKELEDGDFGKIDDVKVNGQSIVTDKVAEIPKASSDNYGVIKTRASNGSSVNASTGVLTSTTRTAEQYETDVNSLFISKGTLENVKEGLVKSVGDSAYVPQPPDAPTVGKVLKIKSVNEDGTFVCEWADIPTATGNSLGLAMASNSGGIGASNGQFFIRSATNSEIDAKTNNQKPIVPSNLEYAVKSVCDKVYANKQEQSRLSDSLETKVEGGRVSQISNGVDIAQVYETVGCPEYVGNDDLSKYSLFGLTESGWYLFARINSRHGEFISVGFSVVGASGVITPSIGSDHVDIAVRFGVIAESQKVTINWGESTETFVFKATDLAIRNLDYRVTFYLYNIDDYCEWTYEITTDEKFVKDKGYYKLIDDEYVRQEVTIDEEIPVNTYYYHKSLVIKDFTRNMSYTLDTTVDCPVTIHLPEVGGDNYGAWFEVQMNFLQTYSVTIIPHEGQKVSANGVHSPKNGINIINILYHKPTNTWLPTVTNWKVSDT